MSPNTKVQSSAGFKNFPGLRKTDHVWNEGQGDDCTSQTVSCENADNANDPQTNWDHYWKMADEGANELVITTMSSKRITTYPTIWTWPRRQISGELFAKPTGLNLTWSHLNCSTLQCDTTRPSSTSTPPTRSVSFVTEQKSNLWHKFFEFRLLCHTLYPIHFLYFCIERKS